MAPWFTFEALFLSYTVPSGRLDSRACQGPCAPKESSVLTLKLRPIATHRYVDGNCRRCRRSLSTFPIAVFHYAAR